jgi:hypothetical protein
MHMNMYFFFQNLKILCILSDRFNDRSGSGNFAIYNTLLCGLWEYNNTFLFIF